MSIVERALAKAVALGRAGSSTDGAAAARSGKRIVGAGPSGSQTKDDVQRAKGDLGQDGRSIDVSVERLRAAGFALPPDMQHSLAEELRLIKRPLLLNAEAGSTSVPNGNVLMVASALPGAGKTFLSMNLALSMSSELDWTVLLIDADVTRPTLSRKLGLGDAPGLVDLLEHERGEVADYVFKTNVPGLHVLPAGSSRPNVKELLGSQRMRAVVADLTERHAHRIVLLDSPPLLLTSEARVLASYAGQIVFVVEAGVTPRRSVLDAIETLDQSKAINLVLNKNRQPLGIGDYHYAGYSPHGREADAKTEG
jgi:receptor protein-tyrosine kinase